MVWLRAEEIQVREEDFGLNRSSRGWRQFETGPVTSPPKQKQQQQQQPTLTCCRKLHRESAVFSLPAHRRREAEEEWTREIGAETTTTTMMMMMMMMMRRKWPNPHPQHRLIVPSHLRPTCTSRPETHHKLKIALSTGHNASHKSRVTRHALRDTD